MSKNKIDEIRKEVISNLLIESVFPPKTGGQSCGIQPTKTRCYCEELDFEITTSYYNSKVKNAELLVSIMELVVDELIK